MHSGEHGRSAKSTKNINFDNDEIKLLVLEKKGLSQCVQKSCLLRNDNNIIISPQCQSNLGVTQQCIWENNGQTKMKVKNHYQFLLSQCQGFGNARSIFILIIPLILGFIKVKCYGIFTIQIQPINISVWLAAI